MNANDWYSPRGSASIPIRTNNLIISCGEKTEKYYFKDFVNYIKDSNEGYAVNFEIICNPISPSGMAQDTIKYVKEKNKSKKIDHVWVLFDKDDFSDENFDFAIKKLEKYSNKETKYHVLWSNQCFELWLLLHFINLEASISRKDYIEKLRLYLGNYSKTDKHIWGKILLKKGDIGFAIKNAKKIIDNTKLPSNNNPGTKVYEIFEFYKKYLNLW